MTKPRYYLCPYRPDTPGILSVKENGSLEWLTPNHEHGGDGLAGYLTMVPIPSPEMTEELEALMVLCPEAFKLVSLRDGVEVKENGQR